jgi:hypothetical protein
MLFVVLVFVASRRFFCKCFNLMFYFPFFQNNLDELFMLMHFLEGESVRFPTSWMLKILFRLVHDTLLSLVC